MSSPQAKFNPIKRPLDGVAVHGIFRMTVEQVDRVTRALTGGTAGSPRRRLVHQGAVFEIEDGFNSIHLDVIRRNSRGLPKGELSVMIGIDQEWFRTKPRLVSQQPEALLRIVRAVQELEHSEVTSDLTGHTVWIYPENEAEPKMLLPFPLAGIAGQLTLVKGLRVANENGSRTATIDLGEERRLTVSTGIEVVGVIGIGTIQRIIEESNTILAQLIRLPGKE